MVTPLEGQQNLRAAKGRHRLMIVEDDMDFALSLRDFLEPRGFDVRIAGTAQEALAVTISFAPEITLLEINLPKDSGLGLIEPLKTLARDMVCLVMTAMEDADLVIEATRVGADGFFRKPFDAIDLLTALEQRFEEPRLQRGGGKTA